MSSLLAVAILLLVLVVGLTILQRRGQTQPHAPRRHPSPPPAPPEPPGTGAHDDSSSELTGEMVDPLLGAIEFHKGSWLTDTDIDLRGTLVLAEIAGTIDGPTNEDHEIVKAALASPDLEARARVLVIAELERRGEDTSEVSPYSLSVKPDENGVLHGFLWFEAGEFLGEVGVESADHWQTIHLVVEE